MYATAVLLALTLTPAADEPKPYQLLKTINLPGDGGWDYLTADDAGRRVYVTHGTEVVVLDADSYEVKGRIGDLKGIHGVALASPFGRGFISDGRAGNVVVFDMKTLEKVGTVPAGRNPDAILFDPDTAQVFAFNGGSGDATVISAKDNKAVGTVKLGGKPESAVADGKGNVFVNIEDKDEVVRIDARKLAVMDRFPIAPGKTPVSLAMDTTNRRLFVGCRSKLLVVLDADSGKVVDKHPIGERVDAGAFDAGRKLVFTSQGDGTVTVIRQDGPDKYAVAETVKTRLGSRTMALDTQTGRIFLPGAEGRKPGTFAVQVFGR
jgi:DNA-binding beta-propeller fold protein YncE